MIEILHSDTYSSAAFKSFLLMVTFSSFDEGHKIGILSELEINERVCSEVKYSG